MPGAAITEAVPIHRILDPLGKPHVPPPIHPPRGPPGWIDADESVFLDEVLNQSLPSTRSQDRHEHEKSSGQTICTTAARPLGWCTGMCAMKSISG
jgi:hypothetical protein